MKTESFKQQIPDKFVEDKSNVIFFCFGKWKSFAFFSGGAYGYKLRK